GRFAICRSHQIQVGLAFQCSRGSGSHRHRRRLRSGATDAGKDDSGERQHHQDHGGDDEGLAAEFGDQLTLGNQPGSLDGRDLGVHWITSVKIWAREGRWGVKLVTAPRSTAVRNTCWADAASASKTARPPSNSITLTPGWPRNQPASEPTSSQRLEEYSERSSSRDPAARTVPPAMITRSSQSRSTTSSWWEENSTDAPAAARCCNT